MTARQRAISSIPIVAILSCRAALCLEAPCIAEGTATLDMHIPLTTIVDAEGNQPTDSSTPLTGRGTDAPLYTEDRNPVTPDMFDDISKQITIRELPEGGTEGTITAADLRPNEPTSCKDSSLSRVQRIDEQRFRVMSSAADQSLACNRNL